MLWQVHKENNREYVIDSRTSRCFNIRMLGFIEAVVTAENTKWAVHNKVNRMRKNRCLVGSDSCTEWGPAFRLYEQFNSTKTNVDVDIYHRSLYPSCLIAQFSQYHVSTLTTTYDSSQAVVTASFLTPLESRNPALFRCRLLMLLSLE